MTLLGLANAFSLIVNSYDHNESLYLTAGWLMVHDHRLYVDFAFWQMPYSPMIYAAVFKIFQPDNHLLAGKITSFFFLVMAAVSLAGLVHHLSRRWWLTLAVTASFVLNITVVRCAMEASNYIMPIAFSLAGCWAAVVGLSCSQRTPIWPGIAGLLMALAVGTKLYYLLAAFGAGVALLCVRREGGFPMVIKKLAVPYIIGFVVGLLPVLPFWFRDPELFMLNNLGAHHHTTAWWVETAARYRANNIEPGLRLTLAEKSGFTQSVLAEPANLALLITLFVAISVYIKSGRQLHLLSSAVLIAAGTFLCAWPAAFAPTPMWYQYLGMPIAFGVLLAGVLLAGMTALQSRTALLLSSLMTACSLYGVAPFLKENLVKLSNRSQWVAVSLPQIARELAAKTPGAGPAGGRLLCLQQLMAIESGLWTPYADLAYAPFTYVIADRLPEHLRHRSHFLGPQALADLLRKEPPAAVLSGLYDTGYWSDSTLDQWCREQGWVGVKNPYSLRIYVPPVAEKGHAERGTER
ncbi:MAG TPA: hypothetical protein VGH19_15775 [Verrucomicrobiae bacterium]